MPRDAKLNRATILKIFSREETKRNTSYTKVIIIDKIRAINLFIRILYLFKEYIIKLKSFLIQS